MLQHKVEWFLRNNYGRLDVTKNQLKRATLCVKLEDLTRNVLSVNFNPSLAYRLGYLLWQANDLENKSVSGVDLCALELHYEELHKDVMEAFPPGSSDELPESEDEMTEGEQEK